MKLVLKYPITPYILYQKFGDSDACTENNQLPIAERKVVGKVNGICPVGFMELYPLLGMKGHTGADMFGGHGIPVYYAGAPGIVEEIQSEKERGLGVGINTVESFEFEGGTYHAKTRYWHLMGYQVTLGQYMKTGDLIGWADSTGLSSGDHLHFELKPIKKNSKGVWYNVFQDNGYFGSVNPVPYFDGTYAHPEENHLFTQDMELGQFSDEIKRLQKKLQLLGYFPVNQDCTGYYGTVTREAVFAFQLTHTKLSWMARYVYKGRYCYQQTRTALNEL